MTVNVLQGSFPTFWGGITYIWGGQNGISSLQKGEDNLHFGDFPTNWGVEFLSHPKAAPATFHRKIQPAHIKPRIPRFDIWNIHIIVLGAKCRHNAPKCPIEPLGGWRP